MSDAALHSCGIADTRFIDPPGGDPPGGGPPSGALVDVKKYDIHPTESLALQQRHPNRRKTNTLPDERPETWGESRSIDQPGGAMVEIKKRDIHAAD